MCLAVGSCEQQSKALEWSVLAPIFVFILHLLLLFTTNVHMEMWKDFLGPVFL